MTLSWFLPLFEHYHIYAPDTIGHPGYSEDSRVSAQDDSFAFWIEDLMNHFNVKEITFLGPSYGGGIILLLATYMSERIKRGCSRFSGRYSVKFKIEDYSENPDAAPILSIDEQGAPFKKIDRLYAQ